MPRHVRSILIAVACLAVVGAVKVLLDPIVDSTETRFLLLLGAVALSAWYGGWVGGLTAVGGGTVLVLAGFGLYQGIVAGHVPEVARLISFLAEATLICWLVNRVQGAVPQGRLPAPSSHDEALRLDEARQASIVDSALDAVVAMDNRGLIIGWNRQAEVLTGWTAAEAMGQPVANLIIPPEQREAHQKGLERYLATGEGPILNRRLEVAAQTRDGRQIPVELTVSPLRLGDTVVFHAFCRDISHRKSEESLLARQAQEAELLYRATQIAAETESIDEALKGTIDIVCELTGWPVGHAYVPTDDGQALAPTRIWHLDEPSRHADFLEVTERTILPPGVGLPGKAWQSGQPEWIPNIQAEDNFPRSRLCNELHLRGAFGFPVRVGSETVAVLEFFHERELPPDPRLMLLGRSVGEQLGRVIERRRARVQLGDSQARLGYTLQAARVANWEWDLATDQVRWSDNMAEIHGLPTSSVGRWTELLETVHPDDRDGVWRAAQRAVTDCCQFHEEYRVRLPNGRVVWIESQGQVSCDEQNNPVRMGGICRDVTERRQDADELMAAKDAAEAASRAKSEFLANISHELRTPMNAIIGMTDLALQEELDDTVRDYLETSRDSAGVLLRLLNDLLDFSKLEAGRFVLDSVPFALRDTLDEAVRTLSQHAYEKGLELACDVAPDVPDAVIGDPVRLQQVILNLAGNAIKFTPKGEVVIRVWLDERDEQGVRLNVAVSDTGIGIPEADQQKVFAPFVQVDSSTTRQFGGTGLGLTITAQLVAMMGGRIQLESREDRGSTFQFDVRLGVQTHVVDQPPQFQDCLVGERVLIVDDNATNRRILEATLARWSVETVTAEDGMAALASMRSAAEEGRAFRLVLLDALMPGMDGFTVAEQIKADGALAEATVLMLSSADRATFARRCEGLDLAGFLEKPVSATGLREALADALGLPSQSAESARRGRSSIARRGLRVLVAEDTPANQKLVLAILSRRGHSVSLASNGRDAIDQFQSRPFDVAVMDVQMPTMDGLQATSAIRRLEAADGTRLPIIALTAHALPGDRDRCLAAGADAYLAKPIDAARLLDLVEELAARRMPSESPATGTLEGSNGDQRKLVASNTMADEGRTIDMRAPLERMGGDRSLLDQLARMFLEDSPGLLGAAATALGRKQAADLQRAAHSLKGLASNFDAHAAASAALRVEELARDGKLDEAAGALETLGRHVTLVRRELEAWLTA
jgi:two-component system sensor histidine kinase/response regulator